MWFSFSSFWIQIEQNILGKMYPYNCFVMTMYQSLLMALVTTFLSTRKLGPEELSVSLIAVKYTDLWWIDWSTPSLLTSSCLKLNNLLCLLVKNLHYIYPVSLLYTTVIGASLSEPHTDPFKVIAKMLTQLTADLVRLNCWLRQSTWMHMVWPVTVTKGELKIQTILERHWRSSNSFATIQTSGWRGFLVFSKTADSKR